MTSEHAVRELAEALFARPTVRVGDDVEPAWRDTLATWAHSNDLELTRDGATLAITTRPAQAAGASWVHSPFAGVEP